MEGQEDGVKKYTCKYRKLLTSCVCATYKHDSSQENDLNLVGTSVQTSAENNMHMQENSGQKGIGRAAMYESGALLLRALYIRRVARDGKMSKLAHARTTFTVKLSHTSRTIIMNH